LAEKKGTAQAAIALAVLQEITQQKFTLIHSNIIIKSRKGRAAWQMRINKQA
jgi:hypothetical protein